MIRDEILNMPAGKDMDMLVLEKVLGYPKPKIKTWISESGEAWDYEFYPPKYSTDISAAWEIVELEKFTHFKLDRTDDRVERWYSQCSTEKYVESVYAPSAPLAICRAALLVLLESE